MSFREIQLAEAEVKARNGRLVVRLDLAGGEKLFVTLRDGRWVFAEDFAPDSVKRALACHHLEAGAPIEVSIAKLDEPVTFIVCDENGFTKASVKSMNRVMGIFLDLDTHAFHDSLELRDQPAPR